MEKAIWREKEIINKEVGRFKVSKGIDIALIIENYRGILGLHIRTYVSGAKYSGFTKSGIKIPDHKFSKFKKIINSINEKDLQKNKKNKEASKQIEASLS